MPKFLSTRGYSSLSIGICDRCRMKRPHSLLVPDPNSPGLRVCGDKGFYGCMDEFDPYRLPPRQPEMITTRFARPDASLAYSTLGIITEDDNYHIVTENGDWLIPW